jgi:hypothetical protein
VPRYDQPSPYAFVPRSPDPQVDALAGDVKLNEPVITFSFPNANAMWPYDGRPYHANFLPLNEIQRDVFRAALGSWAALIPVPFQEVPDAVQVGDIRPALGSDPLQADWSHTWFPGNVPGGEVIWFGDFMRDSTWPLGSYAYFAALHEIGHTLGLTHPWDTPQPLPPELDDRDHTVMSYTGAYSYYPTTPMAWDIRALQYLYGTNTAWHANDDVYAFSDATPYHQTIWDGGGVDTLQYTGSRPAFINLNAGTASRIGQDVIDYRYGSPINNLWIAFGTSIENAQGGSGNDVLVGNELANRLAGGDGDDQLSGGRGDDTLVGGAGADTFEFAQGDNNGVDSIEDFGSQDRIQCDSAVLPTSVSLGNGASVGRFEVQCQDQGGITTLFIGTNTEPGPEVTIRIKGDFAPAQFTLAGQFITVHAASPGQVIVGTGAADALAGTAGDDTVDAGAGLDTWLCSGSASAYALSRTADAVVLSGPEGTDTLRGVERIKFTDGHAIALDVNGDAGQAYRLYQAAFDRAPDLPGLGFHINDLDNGLPLWAAAQHFIESPEFQAKYGSAVDSTQFITLLYRNVLHREPEAAGLQFHLDEFARGETRADMLTHFSESPENQANVVGQIAGGMGYVPLA